MRGINSVVLFGHLGRDPECRQLPSGTLICTLRLATNRPTKTTTGWQETTDWHRIELWEQNASTAERFLRKGDAVGIEGQLRSQSWTDDNDLKRSRNFVYGRRLHLLGSRQASSGSAAGDRSTEAVFPAGGPEGVDGSVIPF